MGDEHESEPHLHLSLSQHHEQSRLLRRIEHARRLVGHEEFRPRHQRTGQSDPLELPPGQLVGPGFEKGAGGWEAHARQRLAGLPVTQPAVGAGDVEWLAHQLANRQSGRQRVPGILHDQLDAPA